MALLSGFSGQYRKSIKEFGLLEIIRGLLSIFDSLQVSSQLGYDVDADRHLLGLSRLESSWARLLALVRSTPRDLYHGLNVVKSMVYQRQRIRGSILNPLNVGHKMMACSDVTEGSERQKSASSKDKG
ncbi:hypothetical protein YC2023_060384 [Brassica napus]